MCTPIASLRWLRRWAVAHYQATARPPQLRHVHLARVLRLGGATADAAAMATAIAAAYERKLRHLGADVEVVSQRVRELLLQAALMPSRS